MIFRVNLQFLYQHLPQIYILFCYIGLYKEAQKKRQVIYAVRHGLGTPLPKPQPVFFFACHFNDSLLLINEQINIHIKKRSSIIKFSILSNGNPQISTL